jgi:hypothetical protein
MDKKATPLRFEIINLQKATYEELSKLHSLVSKNLKEANELTREFRHKPVTEITHEQWQLFSRYHSLNVLQIALCERINAMVEQVDLKEVLS